MIRDTFPTGLAAAASKELTRIGLLDAASAAAAGATEWKQSRLTNKWLNEP